MLERNHDVGAISAKRFGFLRDTRRSSDEGMYFPATGRVGQTAAHRHCLRRQLPELSPARLRKYENVRHVVMRLREPWLRSEGA